jgi:uncharacterized protein
VDPVDASVTVVETHVSTLFFTADHVVKRKKPVTTGFLDFSTVGARLDACRREVELNRRLAPDVYLGVADLTMAGAALDHFVVMRRLPPKRRLAALLDSPDVEVHLTGIARLVADFHRSAGRGPHVDAAADPDALLRLWRTGVEQLGPFVGEVLEAEDVERTAELAEEYLAGRADLVRRRIEAGRACDGHGDLQAEDIFCMDDGPRILDCLEFDDQLRFGDVLADVAFLAMDLERLGHPELAVRFLEEYQLRSGDGWPGSLAHLHVAYRAHVRCKVMCLRHGQGDPDAAGAARSFQRLALEHLERARVHLVVVGGAAGTGKTTVARGLADRLGAVHLSSDDLRGEVVGEDAGPAGELHAGRYEPRQRDAVYAELLRRAQRLLADGGSVVLDASWARSAQRDSARALARSSFAVLTELCTSCPSSVAADRISERAAAGGSSSEVTVELAGQLAAEREAWPEATTVDTDAEPGTVLDRASDALARGLRR